VDVVSRIAAEDARRLLGECFLFRELRAEERNALFALVKIRTYSAGESIFDMGSAGDNIMAVLSGTVRISVPSPGGREIVLAMLQPGRCSARSRCSTARSEPPMPAQWIPVTLRFSNGNMCSRFSIAIRGSGPSSWTCCAAACVTPISTLQSSPCCKVSKGSLLAVLCGAPGPPASDL
jgi:hypothetical protein